jgi:chromosome segregation ATPase
MKKKQNLSRVILATMIMAIAPSALAGTFGAWEQTVSSYDLDTSKTACIAKTTDAAKKSQLTLIFPKDKTSLPLVRINNLNRWKQYIGATYGQGQSKLKGFIIKRGRQQSYYLMAPNAAAFESFINTVRAKSSLKALKLFDDRGQLKAHAAEFSLSGSTNATNAVKACLGSSSLLSSTQKSLFSALQRFSDVRPASITRDIGGLEARGLRIFSALKAVVSRGGEMQRLGDDLRRKENNPRYKELKPIYKTNNEIKTAQSQVIRTLESNQSFYDQSAELIATVDTTIQTTQERIDLLSEQRVTIERSISEANQTLSTLQVDVDAANSSLRSHQAQRTAAQRSLNRLTEQSSALTSEIRGLERSLSEMVGQRRILNQATYEAQNRYDDRHNIARQIENEIYSRFGGTPRQLREALEIANSEVKTSTALKNKAEELNGNVANSLSHLEQIPGINRRLKSINEDLQCYQSSNPEELASCVQKAVNSAKAEKEELKKERDAVAANRCKRLFGIGRGDCKRKRDRSVANFNTQIQQIQAEINALNARIQVIAETGKDPERRATVEKLKQQRKNLVAKRQSLLSKAHTEIQSMRIPNSRNDRNPRRSAVFSKVNELKACTPVPRKTCLGVAKVANESMIKLAAQSKATEERNRNKVRDINTSITNMENALRRDVDGLGERLRQEIDNANTRYENNETKISQSDRSIQSKTITRDSLSTPISNARSEVRAKEALVASSTSRLEAERRKVQDFKDQVGYNSMLSANSGLISQITSNTASLRKSESELNRLSTRQSQIAAEVHTYPERLSTATLLNDEATRIIQNIGSEYEGLDRGVRNVRSQFERLYAALKPSLITFQEQIKTVFSKF